MSFAPTPSPAYSHLAAPDVFSAEALSASGNVYPRPRSITARAGWRLISWVKPFRMAYQASRRIPRAPRWFSTGLIPSISERLGPRFGGQEARRYRWFFGPFLEEWIGLLFYRGPGLYRRLSYFFIGFATGPLLITTFFDLLHRGFPEFYYPRLSLFLTLAMTLYLRRIYVLAHPYRARVSAIAVSALNSVLPIYIYYRKDFSMKGLGWALISAGAVHSLGNIFDAFIPQFWLAASWKWVWTRARSPEDMRAATHWSIHRYLERYDLTIESELNPPKPLPTGLFALDSEWSEHLTKRDRQRLWDRYRWPLHDDGSILSTDAAHNLSVRLKSPEAVALLEEDFMDDHLSSAAQGYVAESLEQLFEAFPWNDHDNSQAFGALITLLTKKAENHLIQPPVRASFLQALATMDSVDPQTFKRVLDILHNDPDPTIEEAAMFAAARLACADALEMSSFLFSLEQFINGAYAGRQHLWLEQFGKDLFDQFVDFQNDSRFKKHSHKVEPQVISIGENSLIFLNIGSFADEEPRMMNDLLDILQDNGATVIETDQFRLAPQQPVSAAELVPVLRQLSNHRPVRVGFWGLSRHHHPGRVESVINPNSGPPIVVLGRSLDEFDSLREAFKESKIVVSLAYYRTPTGEIDYADLKDALWQSSNQAPYIHDSATAVRTALSKESHSPERNPVDSPLISPAKPAATAASGTLRTVTDYLKLRDYHRSERSLHIEPRNSELAIAEALLGLHVTVVARYPGLTDEFFENDFPDTFNAIRAQGGSLHFIQGDITEVAAELQGPFDHLTMMDFDPVGEHRDKFPAQYGMLADTLHSLMVPNGDVLISGAHHFNSEFIHRLKEKKSSFVPMEITHHETGNVPGDSFRPFDLSFIKLLPTPGSSASTWLLIPFIGAILFALESHTPGVALSTLRQHGTHSLIEAA